MNVPQTLCCLVGCLAFLMSGCGGERGSTVTRQQLTSTDPAVRYRAAEELSINQSIEATRLLIAALSDTDRGVRIRAAESLGRRKAKEATAALIAALRDPEMGVRAQAAGALGEIGAEAAVRPLVALLEDSLAKKPKGPYTTWEWGQDVDAAAFALKQMTGEGFAFDTSKWEKWLAEAKTEMKNR
ncbi:MAG: hypothetical protein JWR69_3808 [Pedosphaera sp.]|nr:hypothetical protein [Pedosphaera sp.]